MKSKRRKLVKVTVDVAARSLWRELADERRTGEVAQLNIEDGALCVYVTRQGGSIPTNWRGFAVRVKPYRRPESELETKLKSTLVAFLGVAEKDPERLIRMGEGVVDGIRGAGKFLQENPLEAKRVLRNALLSGAARIAKRKMEK